MDSFNPCLVLFACAAFLAGCGSGMKAPQPPPVPGQNTKVTVFLASDANGKIAAFQMGVSSVTLSNMMGSVTLYQQQPPASSLQAVIESIHNNASPEPLGTVTIPQGVYDSATVNIAGPQFTFVTFDTSINSITFNTDSTGVGSDAAPVMLSSPIVISGDAMALLVSLQVSRSATFTVPPPQGVFTITPAFDITPIAVAAQPANAANGKTSGVHGRVVAVGSAGSLNVLLSDGPTVSLNSDSSTVFQGITSFAALKTGMFVSVDSALQSDGSLRATRLEVEDAAANDVTIGPLTDVIAPFTSFGVINLQQQGDDFCCLTLPTQFPYNWTSNTVFRISGQFGNPANLPFSASFNANTMVVGQNVSVASTGVSNVSPFTPATTITLVPQTLNGTVNALSTSGGFTVYGLTLATYDLIPQLTGNTSVVAYVNNDTQMLTSSSIGIGSVVRFNGLLFNDNGTLRMVAGQASDGVTP